MILRRFYQWRCWVRLKDKEICRFFSQIGRFANGSCKDCKHNPTLVKGGGSDETN